MNTFKRCIALILCLCSLFLFGCSGIGSSGETTENTEAQIDPNAPLTDGKTLKLLAVTSSFGLNTTQFLYDICKAEGFTDVVVGRLYGSGCTLQTHVNNAENSSNFYEYSKNSDGNWITLEKIPMLYGLQDEDWDIIFVQQSADRSAYPDSFGSDSTDYVDTLVDFLNEHKTNPNARFIWNMTWAFQADCVRDSFVPFNNDQMTMYNALVSTVKEKILPKDYFAAIIPSGTAIQNVRTSFIGDNLTKDTLHLNSMGRVVSGYALLSTITKKPITEINLVDVTPYYDVTTPLELTEDEKKAIIEAVNAAIEKPYEVTASSYPAK